MQKIFDVLYYKQLPGRDREFSHKYSEPWGKTEHFCPRCGKQEVWFRNDGGDYYVGEQHICTNCKCSFYLPGGVRDASGEQDEQRLAHLTANPAEFSSRQPPTLETKAVTDIQPSIQGGDDDAD